MAFSRAKMELFAAALNIDPTAYPNDSKLEQAILYAAKRLTANGAATTRLPDAAKVAQVAGDANV